MIGMGHLVADQAPVAPILTRTVPFPMRPMPNGYLLPCVGAIKGALATSSDAIISSLSLRSP
jgi:hypothetical protein